MDPLLPQCTVRLSSPERLQQPDEGAVVAVHLHRVSLSDVQPNRGIPVSHGPHPAPSISVDLHYLVTVLAVDATTSQHLLGWAISVLNESPVFLPSVLNTLPDTQPVFDDGEAVALAWESLPPADLSDVWQLAGQQAAPSATYVARAVRIDSRTVT